MQNSWMTYTIFTEITLNYTMIKADKIFLYIIKILGLIKARLFKLSSFLGINSVFHKFIKLNNKYKIIISILLLILFVCAYKFFFSPHMPEDIKVVEVHKALRGNLLHKVRLIGSIKAKKYYTVTAGYNGTISYISDSGTLLKKGEIIAQIDNSEFEKAYQGALESVKIAEAQYERELKLSKLRATSTSAVEEKYMALANVQKSLAAAKADLDKILFSAPFDGTVGSSIVYLGSRVNLGDIIVSFYDPKDLVVEFDIPADLVKILDKNPSVTINDDKYPIEFIQQAVSDGTYTIPAYVNFECKNCIIGDAIHVDLHVIDKHNIITLPKSCIFFKNGKTFIYKVIDGKAALEYVEIGVKEKDTIEILEGASEGDIIISDGQNRLYPSVKVKIHNPA